MDLLIFIWVDRIELREGFVIEKYQEVFRRAEKQFSF
jgi:hypothetical protein